MQYLVWASGLVCFLSTVFQPDWGFFAHRKVNKYAVYSLPDPLFSFYKKHIDYIELHAVDADKRRYAVKVEGLFHYMDIDHFGDSLHDRTDLNEIRWKFSHVKVLSGDSIIFMKNAGEAMEISSIPDSIKFIINSDLDQLIFDEGQHYFWEEGGDIYELNIIDSFSMNGLLPYRLTLMSLQLENAFREKDIEKILRISADLGHYVGDAHVPLHTTKNYNGQLTGQDGIHAFWESRLPELLLHKKHFLSIRPAIYINNIQQKVWSIISESHSYVKTVLACEKQTRDSLNEEKINCFDERQGRYTWTQCPEFAESFDDCLGKMVWDRWEDSIHSLGSIWYTAWANAGEPDLNTEISMMENLNTSQ